MSRASKSPRKVLPAAHATAKEALPEYYDAEWMHVVGRDMLDVRTLIPAKIGRPTDKPPSGHYRRLMWQRLHLTAYGQRWQSETVLSMIKRRLGSAVNAQTYWSQCRALMLKAVAHNILPRSG